MLKQQLKKQFKIRLHVVEDWIKKVIKDVDWFNDEVCDLLIIAKPNSKDELISLINAHLELEAIVNETEKEVYSVGEAKNIFGYESKNV